MLPALEIHDVGYIDAVGEFAKANRAVVDLMTALTNSLDGCGAMAGNDAGGREWAGKYDPAAAELVDGGCKLADALASMANLLNGSLANHRGADYSAQLAPGQPSGDEDPDHSTESLLTPAPPSAAGGTGDLPSWWHWLEGHVHSLLWPDADIGKLRAAGGAWKAAAKSLSTQQYAVDAAQTCLLQQTSPEIDDASAACDEIRGHITDLATAFEGVGAACEAYAGHVEDAHEQLEHELASFIKWTLGIEAAGGLLGIVTAGITEAAAQAAESVEVGSAAAKVVSVLTKLIDLARAAKAAISTAIEGVGRIVARLGRFVSARVVRAFEAVGEALGKDLPEVTSTRQQLEDKFKHAAAFGVKESRGADGFDAFGKAVDSFVRDPSTVRVRGTYRGRPVILNYNSTSRLVVVQDRGGAFVSGWKMSEKQLRYVTTTRSLGGG